MQQRDVFVTTRMSPELARTIRVQAAQRDLSRSAVIREALRLWLDEHADRQPQPDGDGQRQGEVRDAQH